MYLNVDLDNLWNYELEFGSPPSGKNDLLFEQAMPKMLEIFAQYNAKATLFVVGKDLETPSCQQFCKEASRQGHEIANHTYSHFGNLNRLSFAEKESEIMKCHELIEKHTGIVPVGFRGPGYYIDGDMLQILMRENYLYDSSILPSFANQLMSFYIFLKTRTFIDKVFGQKRWMIASQDLTKVVSGTKPAKILFELPVSTAPYVRWPIHTTYLYMFGIKYFKWCLPHLRAQKNGVYLFHAVDTLDYKDDISLSKNLLPLQKTVAERIQLIEWILKSFQQESFITNRQGLEQFDPNNVPKSRLLHVN